MKRYKGLGRVFSFTLIQQLRQKGWRTTTLLLALACLLIPILSLSAAAQHQKNAAPEQNPVMEEGYAQEALDRADLTPEQRALLTAPVEVTVTGGQTGEGEAMGLLSMLLPFASLMLLYFLVVHFMGRTVHGWTSTIVSIWAIGGLQLLAIGIVGEYIVKIYLETKARPKYIIETVLDK